SPMLKDTVDAEQQSKSFILRIVSIEISATSFVYRDKVLEDKHNLGGRPVRNVIISFVHYIVDDIE
ncbi:13800_t:CDS:2, partial [Dentiscutata erythropus]